MRVYPPFLLPDLVQPVLLFLKSLLLFLPLPLVLCLSGSHFFVLPLSLRCVCPGNGLLHCTLLLLYLLRSFPLPLPLPLPFRFRLHVHPLSEGPPQHCRLQESQASLALLPCAEALLLTRAPHDRMQAYKGSTLVHRSERALLAAAVHNYMNRNMSIYSWLCKLKGHSAREGREMVREKEWDENKLPVCKICEARRQRSSRFASSREGQM